MLECNKVLILSLTISGICGSSISWMTWGSLYAFPGLMVGILVGTFTYYVTQESVDEDDDFNITDIKYRVMEIGGSFKV